MARTLEDYLADEKPEVVQRAKEKADEMRLEMHLAEIRQKCEMTQAQLARIMDVKQPTVAGLEREGKDLRLSTLKRYVESLGGRVRLDIELPDGTHNDFPV
ncbi:putative transcriptional regulator [Halorhodospira halochloris]|uniref:Transcriptional regulator n=1 Tax=Halorhodospira halochloris TaxID=1052 RepID=A0A110B514_HALHR|nr:helix-turn-helix domain-containing protein [Halorhodospira halochloris]MBK1652881.1 transcriptional regulator [Halorhodospira halochloris]BAU57008.1 putative transcriptional regulator [Halorhodospira halochloris]